MSPNVPRGMESRNLEELLPIVKLHAESAIAAGEARTGLKLIVTCTFRDNERQGWIYEQGRVREGAIVTHDPGPGGPHSLRIALDIAPAIRDEHGLHLHYNTTKWNQIADAFRDEGFEWGGDWHGFKDLPHFQYTRNQTLAQIRAGHIVTEWKAATGTGSFA